MKKKIIKISSITLAIAIMLCSALSAATLPPDDPADSELILYGEGSGVYVDGKKIAELQYNTDEVNKIHYFAADGLYYRIANGFIAELTTPLEFVFTYASDKYDNASVEYTVQFDDGGYTFPVTVTYDETAHKYVITATVQNYYPMSQGYGATYNAVIKLNLAKTEPVETTPNILTTYYGAAVTVVPLIVAWYGDNTAYLAITAGLFAIAAITAIIFGVRRNKKKGGDS